jgi:hypothetical protein
VVANTVREPGLVLLRRLTVQISGSRVKTILHDDGRLCPSFTVPQPLVVASNETSGLSKAATAQTFNWYVSTPINNYDVTVNIAPYKLQDHFKSVSGNHSVSFYSIPEDYEKQKSASSAFPGVHSIFEDVWVPILSGR